MNAPSASEITAAYNKLNPSQKNNVKDLFQNIRNKSYAVQEGFIKHSFVPQPIKVVNLGLLRFNKGVSDKASNVILDHPEVLKLIL